MTPRTSKPSAKQRENLATEAILHPESGGEPVATDMQPQPLVEMLGKLLQQYEATTKQNEVLAQQNQELSQQNKAIIQQNEILAEQVSLLTQQV